MSCVHDDVPLVHGRVIDGDAEAALASLQRREARLRRRKKLVLAHFKRHGGEATRLSVTHGYADMSARAFDALFKDGEIEPSRTDYRGHVVFRLVERGKTS